MHFSIPNVSAIDPSSTLMPPCCARSKRGRSAWVCTFRSSRPGASGRRRNRFAAAHIALDRGGGETVKSKLFQCLPAPFVAVTASSSVQVFRGIPAAAADHVALTIGNFDGVHCGHQAMLTRLTEAASDLDLAPTVLTFEPHPREFFAPAAAPARLSTLRDKLERFAELGVARVRIARFDAALARLDADRFIDEVLVRGLGTRWVVVGSDFSFGRGRGGDLALLRASG